MHNMSACMMPVDMQSDSVCQTERGSNTTADLICSQTIALQAVKHLCTVATAQAQARPNKHQTVYFACWSSIIALLQPLKVTQHCRILSKYQHCR